MFSDDMEEDVKIMLCGVLALVIIVTALVIFGGAFVSGAPEPQFWIELENAGKAALQ